MQAPLMEMSFLKYIPCSSIEVLVPRWSAGATGWIPPPQARGVSGCEGFLRYWYWRVKEVEDSLTPAPRPPVLSSGVPAEER